MGALPPAGSTGFGVADSLLVAYGQLVTAAGPAARQHGPSVLGLHALTKSVDFGALAIVRLKCPFRHIGLRSARIAHSEGASFDGSFVDESSITNGSPRLGVPCFMGLGRSISTPRSRTDPTRALARRTILLPTAYLLVPPRSQRLKSLRAGSRPWRIDHQIFDLQP